MSVSRAARRIFVHDFGLKLLSIAIAIFLFSMVRGAEDVQRAIYADVTALPPSASTGKMLVSELPDKVKVTVQGSRSQVAETQLAPVTIDVSDPSLRYYYFEPSGFDLPPGLSIVSIAPSSFPLLWADRVERRLPIRARMIGQPAAGLALEPVVTVNPRTVLLRGPDREIGTMNAAATEPIDVSELEAGRHTESVRLARVPDHAEYIGRSSVRVSFEISPEVAKETYRALPITVLGGTGRVRLRPAVVDVTVVGQPNRVADIQARRVVPFVRVDDLVPGAGARELKVEVQPLPGGVVAQKVEPPEIFASMSR